MPAITFLGTGTRVEVPDDPEGERAAVAAHAEYQQSLERVRAHPEQSVPIEEYAARRGLTLAPPRAPGERKRPTGKRPNSVTGKLNLRLPIHLHHELVAQADIDQVSLNTLIVALLERGMGAVKGLGQDAGPAR